MSLNESIVEEAALKWFGELSMSQNQHSRGGAENAEQYAS